MASPDPPHPPLSQTTTTSLAALLSFVSTPLDAILAHNDGSTMPDEARRRFERMVRDAAGAGGDTPVPAYRSLLSSLSSPPTATDLATLPFDDLLRVLPLVDKTNYINLFTPEERCFEGAPPPDFLHLSSGSGGNPTLWRRALADELSVAPRFEQVLRDSFGCRPGPGGKSSLCIIAFPLGSWVFPPTTPSPPSTHHQVGGLFTTLCLRHLALKGYPLAILAPGNDPLEILRCCERAAGAYDQTVILGYPPFVKTVVDLHNHRRAQGLSTFEMRAIKPKFVFAGEVFSESWRDMVGERSGAENVITDIVSIYGTADAGVLACETPLSVVIRRWLSADPTLSRTLFGKSRLPSFLQYDACTRLMELTSPATSSAPSAAQEKTPAQTGAGPAPPKEDEGRTLCFSTLPGWRGDAAKGEWDKGVVAPLIRYNIHDSGGIMAFDDILDFCRKNGFDPVAALPESARGSVRRLPFVWVFGRSMWTVSLYGANVYVENIMVGLESNEVKEGVTGKFVLLTTEDEAGDTVVKVIVELAPSHAPSAAFALVVGTSVHASLVRLNSEFAHYVPREKQRPVIELRGYGDKEWFPVGVKHKYTV
ncbi:hypothetical protein M427DRAFT_439465 [Gonapodya prolifera JEL478]|uniref:Acetyl-CoA synthetase-like protein n=1 Tax=Gonapodya prolifera (strain JEL478) TaxID=1344416 RepID=A0A139A3Y0_GONPJ|nr:hypothetical protein M427DRAFT_439465 [Gonapodya prolifera JEL478]|eukprot:KXS11379.1 hypothetical protein M427DRAFT_439465 [Gonapodya prolifera JEL478]